MGQISTEQTVAIIESVKEPTNYWWLLTLAIIPVLLGWWLNRKKQ